jgi:FkbM family methyltransferase
MAVVSRRVRQLARSVLITFAPRAYWSFRRWRRGDEEPELALLPALCAHDRVAVDVGANFGMYVSRLAKLSRHCVAFEPIPRFAHMLAVGFGRGVEVHAVALSDQRGHANLRVPDLFSGYSTLDPANSLDTRRDARIDVIQVPVRRLDDYEIQDVGFVKIDVEGHEEAVLRGAETTLAQSRPNLIVEVEERHNPGSVARVVDFMRGNAYDGFVLFKGEIHEMSTFDLAQHQRSLGAEHYARNIIFLPEEHCSSLRKKIDAIALRNIV